MHFLAKTAINSTIPHFVVSRTTSHVRLINTQTEKRIPDARIYNFPSNSM